MMIVLVLVVAVMVGYYNYVACVLIVTYFSGVKVKTRQGRRRQLLVPVVVAVSFYLFSVAAVGHAQL